MVILLLSILNLFLQCKTTQRAFVIGVMIMSFIWEPQSLQKIVILATENSDRSYVVAIEIVFAIELVVSGNNF